MENCILPIFFEHFGPGEAFGYIEATGILSFSTSLYTHAPVCLFILQWCEATTQIGDIAAAGSSDIKAIMPAADPEGLSALPNLMDTLFKAPPAASAAPELPKSRIGLQKASLLTFQSWSDRKPGLVGMIFGENGKQKCQSHFLVVSQSLGNIWNSTKTKQLMDEEKVVCLGIVLAGSPDDESTGWRDTRRSWCSVLLSHHCKEPLCILATCKHLCTNMHIYICIRQLLVYIYICT